ncbi:hypothetical protein LZC95_04770 [Pendulispora brunnea]|uniref:Uncharacterized protein n=1 Tax=Pendulispora brunnea TaxID=2905690 RepID=A0ABZ2KC00_9BACT
MKRAVMGIAGLVLASDGWILIALGYFNLGVVLPLALGARTPLYLRYNIWLREYFALLSSWVLHEY